MNRESEGHERFQRRAVDLGIGSNADQTVYILGSKCLLRE